MILFLCLTLIFTALCWWGLYFLSNEGLTQYGQPLFTLLLVFGGLSPTIATFVVIGFTEGRQGFKAYFKRLFHFKLPVGYYVSIFLFPLVIGVVPALITGQTAARLESLLQTPWASVPGFFVMNFMFGGLEEFGWRGFMQHEMEKKLKPWLVYMIIWVIWSTWHYPLFLIPGVSQYGQSFLVFSIYVLFFTLFLGWLYNRTHSIIITALAHALINTFAAMGYLVFMTQSSIHWLTVVIISALLAGLFLMFPPRKHKA